MPEVTRVTRSAYTGRDRDDYYSSDDDRSTYSRRGGDSYRSVHRYRVTPRDEFSDRSSRLEIIPPRGERIEIDRRSERIVEPERPLSAVDIRPRSTVVERYAERDAIREPERSRTVVYERDSPRDDRRPWERSSRPWERETDVRETDVQIVKRTTERRDEPYEVERYQRETEYYDRPDPPPQPIVIRQRAPEPQQIIVQEAPAPPPVIVPRPAEQTYEIVRREEKQEVVVPEPRRTHEDEYYYRRDVREVDGRRDEDVQVARYDRRGRDGYDRYSDDEDYVVKRKIVRERSRSSSPNHRRHLAEGALAGAGAAALLAHHKSRQGDPVDHKGRNMVGGAALGAIGAEVITRARSRYRDSHDGRSRSRSSSRSKVKTGLGLAAAALVTTAAIKYARDRKANKEELVRGRSRTRSRRRRRHSSAGSYSSYSSVERVTSKHRNAKHRAQSIAKAGAATAAVAGVVEHFRSKSRKRDGSRSKSRIRKGAEIVGSGLAGAAVAGLYENRKAKEEQEAEDAQIRRERRHRSRSRARSLGAYSDRGVDPELGMVQYGTDPVYQSQTTTTRYYEGSSDDGTRRRSRRRRSLSDSRSRSRSRVRDIAGAAAGTAAAAIGINQYQKRKERKERERERERRRYEEEPPEHYYARSYDDNYSPSPPHASGGSYYPEQPVFPPPPGGVTNINISTPHVTQPPIPPYNPQDYPAPPGANLGYPPTAVPRGNNVSREPQSSPVGNMASRSVPFGGNAGTAADLPYFPPPPTSPLPEHGADPLDRAEEAPLRSPSLASSTDTERPHNRSVTFAPLSPTSSRRLHKIHERSVNNPDTMYTLMKGASLSHHTSAEPDLDSLYDREIRPGSKRRRRRRNSDPSSDRPSSSSKHRRRRPPKTSLSRDSSPAAMSDESDVEILPDRFDDEGRPLDRYGNRFGVRRGSTSRPSQESEMVEKIVRDVGDIVEGRKTWKDLLRGVVADASASAAPADSGSDESRRRRN